MSEERDSGERRKVRFLTFGVVGFLLAGVGVLCLNDLFISVFNPPSVVRVVGIFSCGAGFFLGFLSLLSRVERKSRANKVFAVCAMVIPAICFFWAMSTNVRTYKPPNRFEAGMHALYMAMIIYLQENDNQYPNPEKWCDLLLGKGYIMEQSFTYFREGVKRCNFAMNPNCKPNSPGDMVLLFEAEGGWNRYGGKEIIKSQMKRNEYWGYEFTGSYVLFKNGEVKFVKEGKIKDLRWE